jgi:hypothetical protein
MLKQALMGYARSASVLILRNSSIIFPHDLHSPEVHSVKPVAFGSGELPAQLNNHHLSKQYSALQQFYSAERFPRNTFVLLVDVRMDKQFPSYEPILYTSSSPPP